MVLIFGGGRVLCIKKEGGGLIEELEKYGGGIIEEVWGRVLSELGKLGGRV